MSSNGLYMHPDNRQGAPTKSQKKNGKKTDKTDIKISANHTALIQTLRSKNYQKKSTTKAQKVYFRV